MYEKFNVHDFRSKKLDLLMLLPDSWSVRFIQSKLNLKSTSFIEDMKKISKNGNIDPKEARQYGLSPENRALVVQFYQREDNARELPGMKDVKSVKMADGRRELFRKLLILFNLLELYAKFKLEFTLKIGFTSFTLLRPEHCVLAGSSGTHSVCVCIYHQNVKLMLEGKNLLFIVNIVTIEYIIFVYFILILRL